MSELHKVGTRTRAQRHARLGYQLLGAEPIAPELRVDEIDACGDPAGPRTPDAVQAKADSSTPSVERQPRVSLAEVLARADEIALVDGIFLFALDRMPQPSDYELARALRAETEVGWIAVIAELLRQDDVERLGVLYRVEVIRQIQLVTVGGLCMTGTNEDVWLLGSGDFLFVLAAYRVARGFGPSSSEWRDAQHRINASHGREWLLRGLWRQRNVRNRVLGTGDGLRSRVLVHWSRWLSLKVFRAHVMAEMPVVVELLIPLVGLNDPRHPGSSL